MTKDDWYFLIGAIFALLAFFGVDWEFLQGRIPMSDKTRRVLTFVLILASLAMSGLGWYAHINEQSIAVNQWRHYRKEDVIKQFFSNQEVEIDGKNFENCTFNNVTFVFRATAPFTLANNNINGTAVLRLRAHDMQSLTAAAGAGLIADFFENCLESSACDLKKGSIKIDYKDDLPAD
jgi:hypothetical protein